MTRRQMPLIEVRRSDDEYESAGADFDQTRTYRYSLHRLWGGGSLTPWRTALWIMLNPSTADENVLDPTLRRCESFTRSWGYDGFEVCNLFGLRATDPSALSVHQRPVDHEDGANDAAITTAVERADLVVCGWGVHGSYMQRDRSVMKLLAELVAGDVYALGFTKDGAPKHPLYLSARTPLRVFEL